MTNDNQDAMRSLYEVTGNVIDANTVLINRAELRRLVTENEAKDALLRQAVGALDGWVCNFWSKHDDDATKLIAAIRQHLEGRA